MWRRVFLSLGALVVFEVLLLGVLYALWMVWGSEESIAASLLRAEWRKPSVVAPLTNELIAILMVGTGYVVAIGTALSGIWILLAAAPQVRRPGDARSQRGAWVALWLVGSAAASVLAWYLADTSALFTPTAPIGVAAAAAILFSLSFTLFGTLFTTPALIRSAVPLASASARIFALT
jgi:hypothetical protein